MLSTEGLLHDLLDRAAENWAAVEAIETKEGSLTYAGLQERAIHCACWLRDQGVQPGDRVVVEAESSIRTVTIVFGALAAGACFSPIHPSTPPKQRAYIAANAGAALTIYLENGTLVAESSAGIVAVPSFEELAARRLPYPKLTAVFSRSIAEDVACLIYTSGSSGRPKGVTCLHRQVRFALSAIATDLDYRFGDKIFVALPLSFDYGLYQVFLGLAVGALVHLSSPRSASVSLVKELRATEATILPAVPPMLDTLATLARRQSGGLRSLRLVTSTGAAIAPAVIQSLRHSLPHLSFQLMYGLTECKRATICPPDADARRPGTCGLAIPGTEVRILDDNGTEAPPGVLGEIVIRGSHVMAGYWGDEAQTAERFRLRHATIRELRTGDYGWLDADGFLYCHGRKDDIFKQRGFRVSCSEVEASALALPGVKSAVLLPPHGKQSSVLIVCFDGPEFDVLSALRDEVEDYKIPTKFCSVTEIPQSQNRKFDRHALREALKSSALEQKGTVT